MAKRGRPSNDLTPIRAPANSGYYGLPKNEDRNNAYNNLCDKNGEFTQSVQKNLAALYKTPKLRYFPIKDPGDMESYGYEIPVLPLKERQNKNQERLVYEVKQDPASGMYYLKTGLYIGYLSIKGIKINDKIENDIKIEISTGYNEVLLHRMLNVANDIYLDNFSDNMKEISPENTLSNFLGFLFLTSFKAAFAMGVPSEYKTVSERGLNVRGRIDVNKYVQKDMFIGDKFSYSYKQREYVQDIIDVLYLAMRTLENTKEFKVSADYAKYCRQLKQMYSGKRVSHETLRKIERHRSLSNPMYSRYKRALRYARYILELKDIIKDDDSNTDGFQGFLIDVSQLWEIYLEKLLKRRFEQYNYVIKAQEDLELYQDTFYSRKNYPDLVIEDRDGNTVAVIDAKFKKMQFRGSDQYGSGDVDRNDLFQIHSYAGYYNESNRDNPLKFCSLVYPAVNDPPHGLKTDAPLYGLSGAETAFSVGYIKVGDVEDFGFKELCDEENRFLDRIQELLEAPYKEEKQQ